MALFRQQASMLPVKFWERYLPDPDPRRHYIRWKNRRALDRFIGRVVDARFVNGEMGDPEIDSQGLPGRKRIAVDHAFETYNDAAQHSTDKKPVDKLDPEFREILITQ